MRRGLSMLGLLVGCSESSLPPAGTLADSGPPVRAVIDSGAVVDAGVVIESDGGLVTDGGRVFDAGFVVDAGDALDGSTEPPADTVEIRDGRLTYLSPRSPLARGCVDCIDLDGDELSDEWEGRILEVFRPVVRPTPDDPFHTDADRNIVAIGRVFLVRESPLLVRALVALAWHEDYGSTCAGVSRHAGDPERVAIELEEVEGGVQMVRAYTAAHEGTPTDASMRFERGMIGSLRFTTEPRWIVYASFQKHASYGSVQLCEDASNVPCVRERCSEDDQFDLLPPWIDAGEPSAPHVTDLSGVGFPGEDAWADRDFCGGQTGRLCAGALRNKLVDDPFVDTVGGGG